MTHQGNYLDSVLRTPCQVCLSLLKYHGLDRKPSGRAHSLHHFTDNLASVLFHTCWPSNCLPFASIFLISFPGMCVYILFNLFTFSSAHTPHVPPWSFFTDFTVPCLHSKSSLSPLAHYRIDPSESLVYSTGVRCDWWGGEGHAVIPSSTHTGLRRIFTIGSYQYFMCKLLHGKIIL